MARFASKKSAWLSISRSKPKTALVIQTLAIFILFVFSSAFLTSCANTASVKDIMLSYNATKTVVMANIPQGVRKESPNGRELTSNYFQVESFAAEKANLEERAFALVKILGSSRPYSVDVRVFRERKKKGIWRADGSDSEMTEQLGERMKQALADRREDRNVIDDFRAF